MKKAVIVCIFIFIFLITFYVNSYACISTEFNFKKLMGQTEYSISDYSFKSLLEFPLNSYLLGGKLIFKSDSSINVIVSGWHNLTEDAGIMKDSDWLYGYGVIGKDIYSESDAYLDKAVLTDFKGEYPLKVNNNLVIIPNIGFKYQRYMYTVKDVVQYNYYQNGVVSVDGEVLTYDVKYKIPYIGLDANSSNENIILKFGVGFSPFATAKDRDDHLLRYKLSTGDAKGTSVFYDIGVVYKLTPAWLLKSKFNYMKVDTSGYQEQYFYAGENQGLQFSNIANEINLKQKSFDFGIEYRF